MIQSVFIISIAVKSHKTPFYPFGVNQLTIICIQVVKVIALAEAN